MSAARALLFAGVFPIAVGAVLGCVQALWRFECEGPEATSYWTPPPTFALGTNGLPSDLPVLTLTSGATP